MQTHYNDDSNPWLDSLRQKAAKMLVEGTSSITAGSGGEVPLAEWDANGVSVRQMPDDEHGVLRISVGGGPTPVPLNYLVFRGNHGQCVDLLRKALGALEDCP